MPRAIVKNYASLDATPLKLAQALNLAPNSGTFRILSGASTAYGLTQGGAFAETISLLPLGKRVAKPLEAGDDIAAKREALLQPRVIGDFLKKYDGSPLPREDIAEKVLTENGRCRGQSPRGVAVGAKTPSPSGSSRTSRGKKYVDWSGVKPSPQAAPPDEDDTGLEPSVDESAFETELPHDTVTAAEAGRKKRVFIARGKNTSLIEPIKKLLSFGGLEAVVSTEKQTVSKPAPDKVLSDMRSCGASIIHVDDETSVIAKDADPDDAERERPNRDRRIQGPIRSPVYPPCQRRYHPPHESSGPLRGPLPGRVAHR